MLHSLEYTESFNSEHTKTSKCVVINETDTKPFITTKLRGNNNNNKKDISKCNYTDYYQMKTSSKILNIYESTENLSDLFLSERNLVIIPFKSVDDSESILNRLLKVANKNILPVCLMILSTDAIGEDKMNTVKGNLFDAIKNLESQLQASIDKSMKSNEFPHRVQLSKQVNLIEQLKIFKEIINFSAISSDDDVSVIHWVI